MTARQPPTTVPVESDGRSPLQRRRYEATRIEIADAATTLFIDQGFDATTVDQIAGAAGISLRTFYRYCDSKADALTPVLVTGGTEFAQLIADADPQRPLAEVVVTAAIETMEDHDHHNLRGRASRVMLMTPALRQRWLGLIRDGQEALAPVMAERFGVAADSLVATTMAALVTSAVNTAIEHSLHTGDPLGASIQRSVDMLDGGLAMDRD
jgi:AcrR family transcriptional regulator